ncbi:MAG TPA: GIY-YIG nuclease family protein [Candidatus Paceibacterota bacterium]|nr:GIY-YIG nuclease family protein [Candidatus Paceibacterota bacterium]
MHYVYILQSKKDGTYYYGATADLKQRLLKHNRGDVTYSSTKRPFSLVWYAAFSSSQLAFAFEKYLKSSSGHAFSRKHLLSS